MIVEKTPLADESPLAVEAVEWFLRIEAGDAPLEIVMAWQQWLERSEAHRAAYEEAQRTWVALDRVSHVPWPSDVEVARDPYQGEAALNRLRREASTAQPVMRANAFAADFRSATGGRSRTRLFWTAAAGALALSALAILMFRSMVPGTTPVFHMDIATGVAEQRELSLPDGSGVIVGARSSLEVAYSRGRRAVRLLSGEGFFTVAKDAERPFVVDAGVGQVTAIGTAFNVRRYAASIAVQVAEGQVRLDAAAAGSGPSPPQLVTTTALKQGQEAILDSSGALQSVRPLAAGEVAAWRKGRHAYIDAPLSSVVTDLNRYTPRRVVITDAELSGLHITTMFLSDDWRGWLDTLEAAVPELEVRDDGTTIDISMRAAHANQASGRPQ